MNFNKYLFIVATAAIPFSACSEDEDLGQEYKPTTISVSGKVEKGPFISGSSISIQPMDSKLQILGSMYSSTIQDNIGNFSFGSKLFEAPFAELTANGYFFNEVYGTLSNGTLNLHALVDLSDKTSVNINLLTHLKYYRIQHLIMKGLNFKDANEQAQKELFTAFGLQEYAKKDASLFSITEGTNEAAALIAISSLMLVNRNEAELTEYLYRISKEFSESGTFSVQTKAIIKKDKVAICNDLDRVKDNIINRYDELGIKINVKDLKYYIDWDEDGVAGNETLQEGQEVKLESNNLEVPEEGGEYTIKITSPIPVYLEPQIGENIKNDIIEENHLKLYENSEYESIKCEKNIVNGNLRIRVLPLGSRTNKTTTIPLYDCIGNNVSDVFITQKGNHNGSFPRLGEDGKECVKSFTSSLALGMSEINIIEQLYHHNKRNGLVSKEINAYNSNIKDIWHNFYFANRIIQNTKRLDSKQLGVYQNHLNVFSAIYYYYMVMLWGDVPYLNSFDSDNQWDTNIARTPQQEIIEDLESMLTQAINSLEEKRNITLTTDMNDLFLVSKDVARILLANIYMSQGKYDQAEPLLYKVIINGYYELDDSNYNDKETISRLYNEGQGKETILATQYKVDSRSSNITIDAPTIVPIMTYTDVILSYAECLHNNEKTSDAETQLQQVLTAKNIKVSGKNFSEKIQSARLQLTLFTNNNFCFMKRNKMAIDTYGVEEYRLVLPIPSSELEFGITQNPGY